MTRRRDFLKHSITAASVLAASKLLTPADALARFAPPEPSDIQKLLLQAIDQLKGAGATFADARIGRYRRQNISTREQQIVNVVDTDSTGLGVRCLVMGTWGFAATRNLTSA